MDGSVSALDSDSAHEIVENEINWINLFPNSDDESENVSLSRLPESTLDYANPQYWAQRYSKERGLTYDWYGLTYETFWSRYLSPLKDKEALTLLEIGCGNSEWGTLMSASGFSVFSTDIDFNILTAMSEMDSNGCVERFAADALRLPLRGIFDVVVEKGTLDAISCQEERSNESCPSCLGVNFDSVRKATVESLEHPNFGWPVNLVDSKSDSGECYPSGPVIDCVLEAEGLQNEQIVAINTHSSISLANVGSAVHKSLCDRGTWLVVTAKTPSTLLKPMVKKPRGCHCNCTVFFIADRSEKVENVHIVPLTKVEGKHEA